MRSHPCNLFNHQEVVGGDCPDTSLYNLAGMMYTCVSTLKQDLCRAVLVLQFASDMVDGHSDKLESGTMM